MGSVSASGLDPFHWVSVRIPDRTKTFFQVCGLLEDTGMSSSKLAAPVVRAGSPAIGTTTAAALVQQGGELHMGPSDRVWPAKVVRAGPPAVGTTKAVTSVQQGSELHTRVEF